MGEISITSASLAPCVILVFLVNPRRAIHRVANPERSYLKARRRSANPKRRGLSARSRELRAHTIRGPDGPTGPQGPRVSILIHL